jgi:hypothetical protein
MCLKVLRVCHQIAIQMVLLSLGLYIGNHSRHTGELVKNTRLSSARYGISSEMFRRENMHIILEA